MVKIYYKKINMSSSILRDTKLSCKHLKTNNTSIFIIPLFLWKTIEVYNGRKYIPLNINKKKVGFYLKNFIFSIKNKSTLKEINLKINKNI